MKKEIIAKLRTTIIKLRERSQERTKKICINSSEIIMEEVRQGHLDGKMVNRLVIFLRGTGCSDVKKTGGCSFCGFYNATNFNKKVSDYDYLNQFQKSIVNKEQYPIICIYNDGSLFCEDEISFNVLKEILLILEKTDSVKKVILESKVSDLKEEKVVELRKIFSKQLEIAVGFETANSIIRDYCINKSFSSEAFERAVNFCKQYYIDIIPLMIFKPPFLTEQEAIDDYVASLKYLERFNLKRIDMEILAIQKGTLAYVLWKNKFFRPPWFWSIVETLKRKDQENLKTPIYISPVSYTVSSECMPSNCYKCDKLILERFNEYNIKNGSTNLFDDLDCSCKKEWKKERQKKPTMKSIPLRVDNFLDNCHLKIHE